MLQPQDVLDFLKLHGMTAVSIDHDARSDMGGMVTYQLRIEYYDPKVSQYVPSNNPLTAMIQALNSPMQGIILGPAQVGRMLGVGEPLDLEDLGTAIEPIVGWREFTLEMVDELGYRLMSRNETVWMPYEPLVALCRDDILADHDAPYELCTCGIYAWNDDNKDNVYAEKLWAEVNLWGKVLICQDGYRAEYAYPKKLYITDTGTKRMREAAASLVETYGIPVEIVEKWS